MSDHITEPRTGVTKYVEITWGFNPSQMQEFLEKYNIKGELIDSELYITDERIVNSSGYVDRGKTIIIVDYRGFGAIV